jgi:hypothetical protein
LLRTIARSCLLTFPKVCATMHEVWAKCSGHQQEIACTHLNAFVAYVDTIFVPRHKPTNGNLSRLQKTTFVFSRLVLAQLSSNSLSCFAQVFSSCSRLLVCIAPERFQQRHTCIIRQLNSQDVQTPPGISNVCHQRMWHNSLRSYGRKRVASSGAVSQAGSPRTSPCPWRTPVYGSSVCIQLP